MLATKKTATKPVEMGNWDTQKHLSARKKIAVALTSKLPRRRTLWKEFKVCKKKVSGIRKKSGVNEDESN